MGSLPLPWWNCWCRCLPPFLHSLASRALADASQKQIFRWSVGSVLASVYLFIFSKFLFAHRDANTQVDHLCSSWINCFRPLLAACSLVVTVLSFPTELPTPRCSLVLFFLMSHFWMWLSRQQVFWSMISGPSLLHIIRQVFPYLLLIIKGFGHPSFTICIVPPPSAFPLCW